VAALSHYAGKRVAVVLKNRDSDCVVRGTARYDEDEHLGWVLRIEVDEREADFDLPTEILIAESEWDGEITSGEAFGCDFCFHPAAPD
jgi:hypothetical protein